MTAADSRPMIARVHAMLDDALALRGRYPESVDATKLTLLSAQLSGDAERAFAAVGAKLPKSAADDPEICLNRLAAWLSLAGYWRAPARLDAFDGMASEALEHDAIAGDDGLKARVALLRADALALRERAAAAPSWGEIERAYRTVLPRLQGAHRRRARNNLAVAVASQGGTDEAQRLWNEAHDPSDKDSAIAVLNLAAWRALHGGDARTLLETLARDEGEPLPYQTRAWLFHLDRTPTHARIAVELAARPSPSPRRIVGDEGFVILNAMDLGVGFHTSRERVFVTNIAVRPALWLVLPAPESMSTLREAAKKKTR